MLCTKISKQVQPLSQQDNCPDKYLNFLTLPLLNLLSCFYYSFSHKVALFSLTALLKLVHPQARRECSSRGANTIIPVLMFQQAWEWLPWGFSPSCFQLTRAWGITQHLFLCLVIRYIYSSTFSLKVWHCFLCPHFLFYNCSFAPKLPGLQRWGAMSTRAACFFTPQHTKNVVLKRK